MEDEIPTEVKRSDIALHAHRKSALTKQSCEKETVTNGHTFCQEYAVPLLSRDSVLTPRTQQEHKTT